ncbi:MAG TPA: response regulator, partial [Clostridia bacterium]|nr:response regulator [Clostridia bacterium]
MCRVMIVEDEVFVRMGVKSMVRWEALGLALCAEAANGEDAYRLYLEYRPDIILTDLRMPVMGGIEMIRRIRARDLRARFIILTCLDEFLPAQEAVELGVSAYVLKHTAGVEEIEAKLRAAKEELLRLDRREDGLAPAASREAEALYRLVEIGPEDCALAVLRAARIPLPETGLTVAVLRAPDDAGTQAAGLLKGLAEAVSRRFQQSANGRAYLSRMESDLVAVFGGEASKRDETLAVLLDLADESDARTRAGVGPPVDGFERLNESYREAVRALGQRPAHPCPHPKVRAAVAYLRA